MVTAVSLGNCLLWIKKLLIEPNFNNERSLRIRYIQKIKFSLHFVKFLKAIVTVTLSSSCKYFLSPLISLLLIWLLFSWKKLPANTQLCKSFIGVILRMKFLNFRDTFIQRFYETKRGLSLENQAFSGLYKQTTSETMKK